MHRDLIAVLDRAHDLRDVGDVELRIDALREQVRRQGHDADVAGALAVAEQRALDAVGAGHQRELRRGDAGAAVVVRVHRDDQALAVGHVAAEPLDLIGVDVGGRHLDRRGQVEDHRPLGRRLPDRHHRFAGALRERQLGTGEALGRVLEADVGAAHLVGALANAARAALGDPDDAVFVQAEDDSALQRRGRVVEMHDRAFRAPRSLRTCGRSARRATA